MRTPIVSEALKYSKWAYVIGSQQNMSDSLKLLVLAVLTAMSLSHAQFGSVTVDKPTFSPEGKTFNGSLNISIACKNSESLRYTTDGSYPSGTLIGLSPSSTSISIKAKTTVTAMCVNSFYRINSDTVVQNYTLQAVPDPVFSLPAGSYAGAFYVRITDSDQNATLKYTTNGLSPGSAEKSIKSGDSVLIQPPMTLIAVASRSGYANSREVAATYTKKDTTRKPTIKVRSSSFSTSFLDTITADAGASIYYSLNGGNFLPYSGAVKIPEATTRIRAYAIKADQVASLYDSATYTFTPKSPKPFTTTSVDAFEDTIAITLANNLSGSEIHYTLDGKTPSLSDSVFSGSKPIRLDTSRTLTARTFVPSALNGVTYIPSDTLVRTFRVKLSLPRANYPQSGSEYQFKDSVRVTVTSANPKAIIIYTLDGKEPKKNESTQGDTISEIITGDTTYLKAMAIMPDGGISSEVVTWRYVKTPNPRPQAPVAEPRSKKFTGSLNVTIREATKNSRVLYTLDGTVPRNGNGISLDTNRPLITLSKTTTVRMRAYVGGDSSDLSEETYRLQPAAPVASLPGGEVDYGTLISLHCETPQAEIYYTLGDSLFDKLRATRYDAAKPLIAAQNFHLQAKSFLGDGDNQEESEGRLDLQFTVSQKRGDTIVINSAEYASPPYELKLGNAQSPAVPVLIRTTPTGLSIVAQPTSFTLLQPTNNGKIDVQLRSLDTTASALYEITPDGLLFVSSRFPATLNHAGTFVLGRDMSAPKVRLLSQSIEGDDSTLIRIEIKDDIRNSFYRIQSSATGKWDPALTTQSPKDTITIKLGSPKDKPGDIWLRLVVDDYFQSTAFPTDTNQPFVFSQAFKSLTTPKILRLGEEDYRWDLVSFPSSTAAPVNLIDLAAKNPGTEFKAKVRNSQWIYQEVGGQSALKAGQGFWLAADKALQSLVLPRFQTASSDSDGYFRINLHGGWNMIGCPSLAPLKWPVQRGQGNYASSDVRGLRGFSHSTLDYTSVDTLAPWKGYFVFNRGKDTTLVLGRGTPALAAAKQGQTSEQWYLYLNEADHLPILLGAFPGAKESVGREDERTLPPIVPGKEGLRAMRQGLALTEDYVEPDLQKAAHFQLVFGSSESPQTIPKLQAFTEALPPGLQAWAWLPKRGLRQELRTGQNLAWWTSNRDTLDIVVGTPEALGKLAGFAEASLEPGMRKINGQLNGQGGRFSLQLAEAAWVNILWMNARGQSKPLLKRTLLGAGKQEIIAHWPGTGWVRLQGQDLSGKTQWSQIWRP